MVNVASVPQRSPFRYPGGKTWLVPRFRQWIAALPFKPRLLIEPFCGGGIIGLTALMENLVTRVLMCERDPHVSAVWRILAEGNVEELAERILSYPMTRERVIRDLTRESEDDLDHAFQTIVRNRVQRGGIMAPGASLMKTGENGQGVGSRWYPETLARRIRDIAVHRERLTYIQGDAFDVIPRYLHHKHTVYFVDPPYTAGGKRAGKRLYGFNHVDHEALFRMAAEAAGAFMLTYDDAPAVRMMASRHGLRVTEAPMKSTHHRTMKELIVTNVG